jgi:hypothetical protein
MRCHCDITPEIQLLRVLVTPVAGEPIGGAADTHSTATSSTKQQQQPHRRCNKHAAAAAANQ